MVALNQVHVELFHDEEDPAACLISEETLTRFFCLCTWVCHLAGQMIIKMIIAYPQNSVCVVLTVQLLLMTVIA